LYFSHFVLLRTHRLATMAADVLGINPVAGVVTTFKIRFQSPVLRALPTRAFVHVYFPPEFKVESDTISAKRNIDCPFEVINIEKAPDGRPCIILGAPRIVDPDPKSKKPPKPPDVRAFGSVCVCVGVLACLRACCFIAACALVRSPAL
jgi:hypothetical protein